MLYHAWHVWRYWHEVLRVPGSIAGFAQRRRLWLDARFVDGDDGQYERDSLRHPGSDAGSNLVCSLPSPAEFQPVFSLNNILTTRKMFVHQEM